MLRGDRISGAVSAHMFNYEPIFRRTKKSLAVKLGDGGKMDGPLRVNSTNNIAVLRTLCPRKDAAQSGGSGM